jgi:hypothetical protein
MIRKNVASQVVYLPQLVLSTSGDPVTSGATLIVSKDGTEAASAGTLTHTPTDGIWKYTLTQAETNCSIVALILKATGAVPIVLNLITTAADTSAVAFGANTTTPPTAAVISQHIADDISGFDLPWEEAMLLWRDVFWGATTRTLTNLSSGDIAQLRHRLGIDGTATAPSTATGAKLGNVLMTQFMIDSPEGTVPVFIRSDNMSDQIIIVDYAFGEIIRVSAEEASVSISNGSGYIFGSIDGNVNGKVLGGGSGTITGTGVQAQLPDGAITAAKFANNAITSTVISDNAITANKIAASALNGKGDWNIGKTGYTLTVTPPTASAISAQIALDIEILTNGWEIASPILGNVVAEEVWSLTLTSYVTANTAGLILKECLEQSTIAAMNTQT